ncbi:MAG: hypothetical protein DLM53_09165 [Candidatus Eremiobacter antarcticus]|nr:S9 family peptidase [Candidatus Eremiobacteraeota bacterium]MBC5807559.1 S9 family peptidase [Candidatus Eremiobacteraeota bacterium]PZR61389.1 MAG: hypothetical protein DLM53_09165 [Candidatus Eremiobacter sp. RRmetagenome_bin22]
MSAVAIVDLKGKKLGATAQASDGTSPAKRPFVPQDVLRLRTVTDVSLSSDGKRAAITINAADAEKDEYRSAIAFVDLKSGAMHTATDAQKKSWSPRFSPTGDALAFISDRSGTPQVWLMPLDGGEPHQRTHLQHGASDPRWSPDGKRIAFLSGGGEKEKPQDGAAIAGSEGEKDSRPEKPAVRVLKRIRYREDGRGFFQDKPCHVFVIDAVEGDPIQLTSGDDEDRSPAWSMDGTQIAFVSNRTGDPASDVSDLWVLESKEGSTPRRLTPSTQVLDVPVWSADGKTLCVVGTDGTRTAGRPARVGFVSAAGGAVRFVTDGDEINFTSALIGVGHADWFPRPVWIAEGIVGVGISRGRQNLFRVDERGVTRPLTQGDRAVFAFGASDDGRTIVFTASQLDDPVNLYIVEGGAAPRRVTDLNPWLGEIKQPTIEAFPYASDAGVEIDAWLVHPDGIAREQPAPLVLLIHGGPHCAYGYAWPRNAVALSARGCRVLYVNPRGSAGYGEAFARAIHPTQGDIDQIDLLSGVAAAAARGGVDEKRIGVTGGSYGGFMTNLLLGRSDRFAAGVTIACISNWISFYGTGDFGWMLDWEFGNEPWEDASRYLSQSPLTYASKIRAPLLILHGEDDMRCPIEQAEQVFAILQRRGVACEMRRYPGEPHALGSRRPSFAVDVQEATLRWFDAHLKESSNPAVRSKAAVSG